MVERRSGGGRGPRRLAPRRRRPRHPRRPRPPHRRRRRAPQARRRRHRARLARQVPSVIT